MSYTNEKEQFNSLFFDLLNQFDNIEEVCKNRIRSEDWTKEHKQECFDLENKIREFEFWLRSKGFV